MNFLSQHHLIPVLVILHSKHAFEEYQILVSSESLQTQ